MAAFGHFTMDNNNAFESCPAEMFDIAPDLTKQGT
jgi:hypothetical protein